MKKNEVDVAKMSEETSIPEDIIRKNLKLKPHSIEAKAIKTTIRTAREARRAYVKTMNLFSFIFGSDAEDRALRVWKEVSLEELKSAKTAEEVKDVYENAPFGKVKTKALKRLSKFYIDD